MNTNKALAHDNHRGNDRHAATPTRHPDFIPAANRESRPAAPSTRSIRRVPASRKLGWCSLPIAPRPTLRPGATSAIGPRGSMRCGTVESRCRCDEVHRRPSLRWSWQSGAPSDECRGTSDL